MIEAIARRARLAQFRAHARPYLTWRKTVGERLLGQLLERKYAAERHQKRGQRIWLSRGPDPCWCMKLGFSRAPLTLYEGGSLYHIRKPRRSTLYDIGRERIDCEVPF